MAAFNKKIACKYFCLFVQKLFLTFFFERTKLLFCLGVASFQHIFQIAQTGHSTKKFFRSINRCVPEDASCQFFCVHENFYASGVQDAGVTKSLLEKHKLKQNCYR